MGSGSGQVVNVPAFYFDDRSLQFYLCKLFENDENKQKETGVGPFFTKNLIISHNTFFCQTKTTLLSLEPTWIFLLSLISAETGRKVAPR